MAALPAPYALKLASVGGCSAPPVPFGWQWSCPFLDSEAPLAPLQWRAASVSVRPAVRLALLFRKPVGPLVDLAMWLAVSGQKAACPLVDLAALRSAGPQFAAQGFAPDPQGRQTLAPATPPRPSEARKGAVFACFKLR